MKAVVFQGVGRLVLEDYPEPEPSPGEVRIRVHTAGVCMTDWHIIQGHFPVAPPRILGHELVGDIDRVGEGVDASLLGMMVAVATARFCGVCAPCRYGAQHLCVNFQCLGNTHDGGFAEYALAHADQVAPLGKVPPERGVWAEPLACVLHALEAAQLQKGMPLLVVGAGTLGRLMIQAGARYYRTRVGVVDPNMEKLVAAADMGAEAVWSVERTGMAEELGSRIRSWGGEVGMAVVDTSGKSLSLERIIRWAGPKARIVLFGVSPADERAAVPMKDILSKELTITAVSGMTTPTFAEASQLLAGSEIDTASLVEEIIALDDLPERLGAIGGSSKGKLLVQPGLV